MARPNKTNVEITNRIAALSRDLEKLREVCKGHDREIERCERLRAGITSQIAGKQQTIMVLQGILHPKKEAAE